MRKALLLLAFFCAFAQGVSAQALGDSLTRVKNLINEGRDEEAYAILDVIEDDCASSENDTLKVLFHESRAVILVAAGRYAECIPHFQKSIELYESLHIKAQNYVEAFAAIGFSYGRLGDYDNAEKYLRKALLKSVAAKHDGNFRPGVYQNLGNLYMEKGDTLLAQECYKRVNGKDVEATDFMDVNYIEWETTQLEHASRLTDEKRHEEAADFYVDFINKIREKRGNKHDTYLLAVYSRGILLSRYVGKTDEAMPLFIELVNLSDSIDTPNGNICGAYCNLASCYSQKGNYGAVDELMPKGLRYLTKAGIEAYTPHTLYRFAGNGAYWKQDYPNAIKYYEQYFSISGREAGTNHEEIANRLSVSYILSDMPQKAKDTLERLLKTDGERLQRGNGQLLSTIYHNLGRACMLLNDKVSAADYLTKSKDLQEAFNGEVAERTLLYIQECQK